MARSKVTKRKRLSDNDDGSSSPEKVKKRKFKPDQENVLVDTSIFGELITKAGIVLKSGNQANQLTQDQAVFQKELVQLLKRHSSYPEVIDEFIDGFVNHLEDTVRFRWSLMPCFVPVGSEACSRGGTQDSMVKLLLGIDILQSKIMEKLLEKLAELSEEEEEVIFDDVEKVNFPRLIMNQFRWLDVVVNSKELVDKMFEILTVASTTTQREIIACMPEVVEDSQHSEVTKQLRDLLLESNELAIPILDALSNMSLSAELLSEVRTSVLQTVHSVSLSDMPVTVKFLLQTLTPNDALEVIKELRNELDFSTCLPSKSKEKGQQKRKDLISRTSDRSVEALTVDAVKSAIRFQRFVAEAWIKAIDNVKAVSDHKPLDIIVLLILHSNNYKKPVESLFRNKIRSGKFSEALLQRTFTKHDEILRDYFQSVLSIAEVLLHSVEPNIKLFASQIYRYGFNVFDTYCQQEIIGNLVTHMGSGIENEIDASLDILVELSSTSLKKMTPFTVFVKGILDYMDNLTIGQIRKLYSILSMLAFKTIGRDEKIQSELHILIRKQLSHNDIKYKRMGVIGAVMIIQGMAGNINDSSESTQEMNAHSDDCYKQVVTLLELVKSSCSHSSEAAALFMDELAMVVYSGKLDGKVENWITENVTSDFLDNFVVDIDQENKEGFAIIPWKTRYGLDDESENSIVINLVPMLAQSYNDKNKKGTKKNCSSKCLPLCLSPNFHLLQVCESRQNKGDLTGIDALLGCPLYAADDVIIEKCASLSTKEKELLADSLFLTVNWFIELLNAFGSQESTEMKGKIIARLQNITELRSILERVIAVIPDYVPLPANFDLDNIQPPAPSKPTSVPKKTKKPGKGKKKTKNMDKENIRDESDDSRDSALVEKVSQVLDKDDCAARVESAAEGAKVVVDLDAYVPFFREIDMSVFNILKVGLITKAAFDTEMNTKATTVLQIQPPQLEFLLKDLVRKAEHALIASKRITFLKSKTEKNVGFCHLDCLTPVQVCTQLVQLLPSLCDQLENTSAFFQSLQAANDGMVDGPGYNTKESQLMSVCFHLLLKVFLIIFSWSGFQMEAHHRLQKDALSVLAARLCSSATSQLTFKHLVMQAFQYLEHFSASIPSLPAAVTLCKLLSALAELVEGSKLEEKIGLLSAEFLKREWLDADGKKAKGSKHNERLKVLLKIYLDNSSDVLGCLEDLATVAVPELIEPESDGYSTKYPTLTRNSFPVFYKMMLAELVNVVKAIHLCTPSDTDDIKMEKLCEWHIAVRVFYILVNLIKTFDYRSNLNVLLKCGRQFVEIFLRQGMPLLDEIFRLHKDDVLSLLKNLQLSTRALQHLCGHSKILRDVSLTNQVPLMKKVLEVFVYRVKAMLTMNKCLEAFWLGNLKNRDLKGEEIVSQSTSVAQSSDDDEEEEAAEDEEDSEVELDNVNEAGQETNNEEQDSDDGSYSVTY